jgi:hypothetical protein
MITRGQRVRMLKANILVKKFPERKVSLKDDELNGKRINRFTRM